MKIDLRGVRKFYVISFALVFVLSAASYKLYFSDLEPLVNGYDNFIDWFVVIMASVFFGINWGILENTLKEVKQKEFNKRIKYYAKLLFSNQLIMLFMYMIVFVIYILTFDLTAITMVFLYNILFVSVFYPGEKRTAKKLGVS